VFEEEAGTSRIRQVEKLGPKLHANAIVQDHVLKSEKSAFTDRGRARRAGESRTLDGRSGIARTVPGTRNARVEKVVRPAIALHLYWLASTRSGTLNVLKMGAGGWCGCRRESARSVTIPFICQFPRILSTSVVPFRNGSS